MLLKVPFRHALIKGDNGQLPLLCQLSYICPNEQMIGIEPMTQRFSEVTVIYNAKHAEKKLLELIKLKQNAAPGCFQKNGRKIANAS